MYNVSYANSFQDVYVIFMFSTDTPCVLITSDHVHVFYHVLDLRIYSCISDLTLDNYAVLDRLTREVPLRLESVYQSLIEKHL